MSHPCAVTKETKLALNVSKSKSHQHKQGHLVSDLTESRDSGLLFLLRLV